MRKITKICDLSTEYKKWEEGLEANNRPHPDYDSDKPSTKYTYYEDVKMQLLRCQKGLCAYTEFRLCRDDYYAASKWKEGKSTYKYTTGKRSGASTGSLDHFDSSLKKNKGWLWDNFFVVCAAINTEKKEAEVSDFLKPDRDDYDPKKWFFYDEETDMFIPNPKLSEEAKKTIKVSIKSLGLNNPGIVPQRENELQKRKTDLEFGNFVQANLGLNQFYTAMDFLIEIYRKKEEEKESLHDYY